MGGVAFGLIARGEMGRKDKCYYNRRMWTDSFSIIEDGQKGYWLPNRDLR